MTVADLKQHLGDLARFLSASGAKTTATDLEAIQQGLTPFQSIPLKAFAEFLVRAEAYSRGEVPVLPGKRVTRGGKGGGKPSAAAQPKPDFGALEKDVLDLYNRAADPSVTTDMVASLTPRLNSLKKDDLVRVCNSLGMSGMKNKKIPELVKAITDRILARKGATTRSSIIDREPSLPRESAVPEHEE